MIFGKPNKKGNTPLLYVWMHQWGSITLQGYAAWHDDNGEIAILDEDEEFLYIQMFSKKNKERLGILRKKSILS